MKPRWLLLLATLLFAACGSKREQAVAEFTDLLTDVNDVLDDVKDKKSAEAARPKLDKLGKRMQAVQEKMEKLPPPTEADAKLSDKHSAEMEKQLQRFMANSMRIAMDPELAGALEPLGDVGGHGR